MILKPETSKESKPSPNLKRVEVSCFCSARNPVCQIPGQKIITKKIFFIICLTPLPDIQTYILK